MAADGGYPMGASYDEMFAPGGVTRASYRLLRERMRALSFEALSERQRTLERSFLLQGITFTVYGAESATERIIPTDLFPRISLTGLIGFASNRFASLGEANSQQYSLAAGLTWPLLDFGRVRARIGASQARALQALAGYEQTVATALEETEGALTQFTNSAQQADKLASAARNAEDATRLSRLRFDAGAVDFLIVLDAERQSLAARDALVQAQVGQATALVSIYRALGGGWSDAAAPAVAAN